MRTDKIRKYVLPNIPYLFIGWACLKMGMAYRLAAGANFGEKLLGLMQTIGVAFADFSPGLDPFDWLVGIVGAVAFRLLIYFKSKNAKKYRRDEEYGSSRWGGPKDIQPFVDPKFENNIILTGTELLTMNTRQNIPDNALNPIPRMWWLIPRAVSSGKWATSFKKSGDIKSRFLIALIFPSPCTITRWRTSRTRPTS